MKQERNRITELTQQDNDLSEKLDTYYDQTMLYISKHLTAFYEHYAIANSVTTVQATQTIDSWGLKRWRQAIDELETDDWLPDTKERAKAIAGYAGLNVGNLMSCVAALAVINLINKNIVAANKNVEKQLKDEKTFLNKNLQPSTKVTQGTSKTVKNGIKNTKLDPLAHAKANYAKLDKPSLSANLWTDGDKLVSDVRSRLFDHFLRGGDLSGLDDILANHTNENQYNPNKSLSDRIKQHQNATERLMKSESAILLDYMDDYSYKKSGIKYVNWVTEPGACVLCQAIAAGGPYLIDEAPRRVVDTHPNCRCGKTPAAGMDDYWNQTENTSTEAQQTAALYKKYKAKVNSADLVRTNAKQNESNIRAAIKANTHGGSVDIVNATDVKPDWKLFANRQNLAGVTVKSDGDIIGVFKNPKLKTRHAVTDLIINARQAGGTKMDCYGKMLVNSYEKAGFEPVARVPFNAEYVDNPVLLKEQPDVFMMKRTNKSTAAVVKDIANSTYKIYSKEDLAKLPTIEDYDEAMAYRDNLLKKMNGGHTND